MATPLSTSGASGTRTGTVAVGGTLVAGIQAAGSTAAGQAAVPRAGTQARTTLSMDTAPRLGLSVTVSSGAAS